MDSIASCVTAHWRSRTGYCEESFADDEWQYDGLLSLYEPAVSPVSDDPYYDLSEDLLPPLPPAVMSSLARSRPQPRKRNVLRRCPRTRTEGKSLRDEYLELQECA